MSSRAPERTSRGKKTVIASCCAATAVIIAAAAVIFFSVINGDGKKYDAAHFGLTDYKSSLDADGDGIDDVTDFLQNVKAYLDRKPEYKSAYYAGGYPDDGYGVCTDVVAFGLLDAGYDLRELIDADRREHPENYDPDEPIDKNIDYRRVRNLLAYLKTHATEITADLSDIGEWQPGDIVIWDGHVGVLSENRTRRGWPYVYHHGYEGQTEYQQDVIRVNRKIIGHFRIS